MSTNNQDRELIERENAEATGHEPGAEDVSTRQSEDGKEPGGEGGEQEQRKELPVKVGLFADKRKAIAEKARQMREEANAGAESGVADGEEVDPRLRQFGRAGEQEAQRRREEAGDDDRTQQQPPAKRKLKVFGREIELGEDEIAAHAQKSLAAEQILEDAKQKRLEAEALLESLKAARENQPPAKKDSDTSDDPKPDTTADDDKELDEIVDHIQVGDPQAAKEAAKKLIARAKQEALKEIGNLDEVIPTRMAEINEAEQRRRDTRETIKSFNDDNPDFKASVPLQAALAVQAADTMRQELYGLGVKPETLDGLKAKHNLNDTQVVGFAMNILRQEGHQVSSHGAILTRSAAALRKQFGMPEPQRRQEQSDTNFSAERRERKQALAPQPRRAGTSVAHEQQERSREEVRANAIKQMRAARGKRA